MLRTIILGTYFWLIMLASMALFPLFYLLKLFSWKAASVFLKHIARRGTRLMFATGGIKLNIKGIEKLPETDKICFISNHQSYLDIPILVAAMPKQIGFVAKKELNRIPLINIWMNALGCVIIDRKKPSSSMKKTEKRINKIPEGQPLVIFPEGTRSKSNRIGNFKTGGISLLTNKDLVIVPVTLNGTYKLLEKYSRLKPGAVDVTIHEPISAKEVNSSNYKELAKKLKEIINNPL